MQVGKNILVQPDDALQMERIEVLRERWTNVTGMATTATVVWSLVFGVLVWTASGFDYSWSPLSWITPVGAFVASGDGVCIWQSRKLRAEKRKLRDRVDEFVIGDEALNELKTEVRDLANSALECCDTRAQQRRVIVAYNATARELLYLDTTVPHREMEGFQELRNELRRIGDEVAGERERKLL